MDPDDPHHLSQLLQQGPQEAEYSDLSGQSSPVREVWYEEEEIAAVPQNHIDGEYQDEEDPLSGAEPRSEQPEYYEKIREEHGDKTYPAVLPVSSVMGMAQSVGCNIPEDLAHVLGDLAMKKLRHAVLMASQFRRHEMSFGLTVEQFSKAESIMSANSVGHDSYFASPKFKYVGKSVSVLEDDKLIDVHRTFKKLPKGGNRKKSVTHNVALNIYHIANERVDTVLEEDSCCSSSESNITTKYNFTHSVENQKENMSPDSDSSLDSSDSDNESPYSSSKDSGMDTEVIIGTRGNNSCEPDRDLEETMNSENNGDTLDFIGTVDGSSQSSESNFTEEVFVEHKTSRECVDVRDTLETQNHQDVGEQWDVNGIVESPETPRSPSNESSHNDDIGHKSDEEVTERESQLSHSRSGSGSENEDDFNSRVSRRKLKSENTLNEFTEVLETLNYGLAEHVLVQRLEYLMEKILVLNEEEVSEDDDRLTVSEIELPTSPADRELENANDVDSPEVDAEVSIEKMDIQPQDISGDCNNSDSVAVDESDTLLDDLRQTRNRNGVAVSSDEEVQEDIELGIEWLDYLKVFVSNFFYSFENVEVCISESLAATASRGAGETGEGKVNEELNGHSSPHVAKQEAEGDNLFPKYTEINVQATSDDAQTDMDAETTDETAEIENQDIADERTDTNSQGRDDGEASDQSNNESQKSEVPVEEQVPIDVVTAQKYKKLKDEVERMKLEYERIISDISAYGIYQVFSVVNCFFHDYMRSKFGCCTIRGLRKILDVISASLNCPVRPGDHNLRHIFNILVTMLALPAPCELHQYITRVFMQVYSTACNAFRAEVMAWMCSYISQNLDWYTTSCFHNVQYKASAFHGALMLVNALENAGIRVTLYHEWHTPILKFIEGTQLMRSKLSPLRRRPAPEKNEFGEVVSCVSSSSVKHTEDKMSDESEWSDDEEDIQLALVVEMDGDLLQEFCLIEQNIMNFLRIILTNYRKKASSEIIHKIQRVAAEHYGPKMMPVLSGYHIFDPFILRKNRQRHHRNISDPSRRLQTGNIYKANKCSKYSSVFQDSPLAVIL